MPDGPPFTPLTTAAPANEVPGALSGQPSLARVAEVAAAGPSRLEAETFALAVAHLFTDSRPGFSAEQMLRLVAARAMPTELRSYLTLELDGLRKLGWGQHYDTSLEMWIRSAPHGDPGRPHRVDVEVFAHDATEATGSGSWSQLRFGVVRQDEEWRLLESSGGPVRGDDGEPADLTPAQRKKFLTGPGWRRIPPA
ncbi:hypothetical protein [Nocardioides marmoriginsengisoli]|nr:hypothetical protein [Nocardioides marmoriginsengisoli]